MLLGCIWHRTNGRTLSARSITESKVKHARALRLSSQGAEFTRQGANQVETQAVDSAVNAFALFLFLPRNGQGRMAALHYCRG
jgi:hypothetical protein